MNAPTSRILLLEDDAAVRRFVSMALMDLDAEVVECATVAEALAAMRERPVQLLFTDLTLLGESGTALIQALAKDPALSPGAKVVVFSGGLHSAVREQLAALGVWRCLVKPASLAEIETCAREGLNLARSFEARPGSGVEAEGLAPHELAAIESFFDGDRQFYENFRDSCVKQFVNDISDGDMACRAGDAPALRRTAHSLKSVLKTLGYADHSVCAKALEDAAQSRPWDEALAGWQQLRERIARSFKLSV